MKLIKILIPAFVCLLSLFVLLSGTQAASAYETVRADKRSSHSFSSKTRVRRMRRMNKIKKRIASIACAFTMMLSSVTTCFSVFGAETGTDPAAETTAFTSETVTESTETTQTEPEKVLTEQAEVLTEQSISLYPNGEAAEQVITLNGMMPEGATAEAVDVSEFHEGAAAYCTISHCFFICGIICRGLQN